MQIDFREATDADADLLLSWRNDPDTKKYSRRKFDLDWATLSARRTLLASSDNLLVGYIQIEGSELSWVIAPCFRGKGYGTAMVAAAVKLAGKRPTAVIYEGNEASIKIAQRLGISFQII